MLRCGRTGSVQPGSPGRAPVRSSPIAHPRRCLHPRHPWGPFLPGQANEIELGRVKSPIFGTFYRAPSRAAPFVDNRIDHQEGRFLCVLESMKLDERNRRGVRRVKSCTSTFEIETRSSTSRTPFAIRRIIVQYNPDRQSRGAALTH